MMVHPGRGEEEEEKSLDTGAQGPPAPPFSGMRKISLFTKFGIP